MEACDACKQLIGQPPALERHAGLTAFTNRKTAAGWHEMYLCRACGSRLQRVAGEPGTSQAGEPWTRIR